MSMKTNNFFLITMLSLMMFALTSCDKETVLNINDTPSEIQAYIKTHFPAATVAQIIKDRDGFTKGYEVFLNDGTKLEFNSKNAITDIDGNKQLPNSVIPDRILTYVNTNFSSNVITDWELDDKNQKVGLDNDLELLFNMSGDFLRLD